MLLNVTEFLLGATRENVEWNTGNFLWFLGLI